MKKTFKILLYAILGLISLLVLSIGSLLLYTAFESHPDANSYADSWQTDMDYDEVDQIALDLVDQMSLDEKLAQMSGDISFFEGLKDLTSAIVFGKIPIVYSGGNDRLRIPPFAFSDGPRGIVVTDATAFPVAMARGASWDRDLEYRVGDAIGKEARAAGANYFGGVCLNLLRHPAWGRAQETFGEDPWHVGTMGVALLNGVQHHNVMACAKHFALNSIENSRFKVDVSVDERTLREVYLAQFRKVEEAGVASVMSAYNKVRGEYCGQNKYLLTDILREDWGFQGFVSSDWFRGLMDGPKGVEAGMDVEMPVQRFYGDTLKGLIESGQVPVQKIDEMVRRIVRTKLFYSTRTDPQSYSRDLLACEEHRELARESAEKSMVLLKNEHELLPLSLEKINTLAVVGELAKADITGDRGSSGTHPPYIVTVMEGLKDFAGDDFEIVYSDGLDIELAKQLAGNADAVLFIVGYSTKDEGEFIPEIAEQPDSSGWGGHGDRPGLGLKPHDVSLLRTVAPANPNCVVTLIGGSAIMMNEWENLVPSILMAWYPGMEGGTALANILFGKVNPSGKLPFTIPAEAAQLPFFKADIDSITYGYYHGYTMLDKKSIEPAYPFGYGLSYTSYAYDNLRVEDKNIGTRDSLVVSIEITNTGGMAGEEVAQCYIGFENSAINRPVKLLRSFQKIHLEPNETRAVTFVVPAKELGWYNPDSKGWQVERMAYSVYAGGSSRNADLIRGGFRIR